MVIGGAWAPLAAGAFDLALYGAIVISAILVLGALVAAMRRRLQDPRRQSGGDFSVEQVERLRDSGSISDEEFAMLRRRALGLGAARAQDDNGVMDGAKGADEDMEQGQD